MKRMITIAVTALLLITLSGVCVFAAETAVTEAEKTNFDNMLEKVTNSTFWTTTGTVLAAVVGMLAMLKKHFGTITAMISGKADTRAINEALKTASTEISAEFTNRINELEKKLSEADDDEKKLMAMFTIFVSNANINPNAKAEIMKYLTGIKDISGKVIDVVETANRLITEANKAEEKIPTPTLDAIMSEEVEADSGMLLD